MEVIQIYDTINKKSLKVKVTPQIAKRCKSDPSYTQALFSQIRNKNFGINSSIKITPVANELETKHNKIKTENENWSENQIIQLINVFKACKSNLDSPHSKPKLWIEISQQLDKRGITKSSDQCRQKWIKLLQAYHRSAYSDKNNRFEYMQQIADALYVQPTSNEEEILNDSINEETQGQNVKAKENWTKYDTIKFLKIYQRYKKRRAAFSSGTQFWQHISKRLEKDGIYKSKEKLIIKWKNLYRTYHRLCNSNNPIPKKFKFFHEVNCVLNDLDFPDPIPEDVNDTKSSETTLSLIPQAAWTAEETLKLIRFYKKHQQLFKMPNHKYAWKVITDDMRAAGCHKDIPKCKNKWKNLQRSFRRNMRNKCTRFYFYNEMKPIMKFKDLDNFSDDAESQDEDSLDNDENEDVMECEKAEMVDSDGNEISEEIIINHDDNSKFWPQEEISTLIGAYATFHDDLKEKFKTDEIWETISQFMKTKNFTRCATECKDLWNTLFNQFTKARKDGSNDCPFYEEMNNVYTQTEETSTNRDITTTPIKIECSYSIDNDGDSFQNKVEIKNESDVDEKVDITFSDLTTTPIITENERYNQHTVQSKHNCNCAKNKEDGKERRHIERMEMIKKQLEIEERKVKSFELFVHYLITRNKDLISDEENI